MGSRRRFRRVGLEGLTAAAVALALLPAAAAATDRWVDNSGMGAAPCTNQSNPCNQISTALASPAVSGDVIHVGGNPGFSYTGNLALPDGVSLVQEAFTSAFDTTGVATIGVLADATPAVTVATGSTSRTLSGFRLRGGNTAFDPAAGARRQGPRALLVVPRSAQAHGRARGGAPRGGRDPLKPPA